jgi:iron complex outermembrane receptor protein
MDRVEVIKGPATLVYGPEAMGGVIHVIEEQPAPVGHTLGDASIGGYSNGLGFKGQAGLKGATDKYFWSVRGGGATFADYFDGNNNRVANSRFGEGVGMGTIGINRHWGTSSISYMFNQSFYGVVEANEKPNADGETFPREAEAPYHNVTYQKITSNSTFILGKSKLKTVFAYQNDQRGEYEPDTTNPTNKAGLTYIDLSLQSYTYDVRWEVPTLFKHWDVVVGSQGMVQKNINNRHDFRIIPNANQNDISAFAAGKLHLGKLAIEQGIRYDQRNIATEISNRKSYQNISGALGFTYDVEEHLLLRANIASGYKAPNLNELFTYGYKLETRRFEIGDTELKHEHNTELDVSAVFKSRHISLEVSAYRNTVYDYIYLMPTGQVNFSYPEYKYKQGDAILQGLEAGIDIHPASLHGIHLESKGSIMEGKHIDGGYLPFMPANRISNSIVADWKNWKKLDRPYTKLTVISVFDQNKVAANELVTPAYTLVNLALGTTLHYKQFPIDISLAANNLLNQVYYDHLSRLRKDGVYNMGTNVALNIRVPFNLK